MLHILWGQDDYSRTQELHRIRNSIGDAQTLESNTTLLEGQQITVNQLRPVCEAAPFLAEKRLVIITGLLQRFEPPGRRGRARRRRAPAKPEDPTPLGEYLLTVPESTLVVLVEDDVSSGNPLFRILLPAARVRSFPLPKPGELVKWVRQRVAEEGGAMSTPAVNLLARLVGSNLWVMSSEIAKLVIFASGRRIEEEDVRLLVGYTQQVSIFGMVDAVLESRARDAERSLQQLLYQGAAPSYVLTMLARQLRLIVRAREVRTPRMSAGELGSRIGLTNEFAARKTMEQAARYSLSRIKEAYHQLLETDVAIKTGRYEPELALSIMVAELCQQHPATAGTARR